MTVVYLLIAVVLSFGVTCLWVAMVGRVSGLSCLRRWTEPPDPEVEALDALEEIWRMP
jgi:hypothetical protein